MNENVKQNSMKTWVLLLFLLAMVLSTIGGAYAYITAKTQEISNRFEPVEVTCQVEETFDGAVKQDVCIRNTGDINGFIRAMLVFTWVDGDGKVLSDAPAEGTDYTIEWGSDQWKKGSDGFWYYSASVAPNATTELLIKSVTPTEAPEGHELQVQIFATAIQADPPTVVAGAWGVTVTDHMITPS
ncbi:MAG: hypothetical protein E7461_00980 [Ruminococcaceae bacterium]|nr:hypothetical protein [Oscillospiraceae bacterium]